MGNEVKVMNSATQRPYLWPSEACTDGYGLMLSPVGTSACQSLPTERIWGYI
jgi:hypothetical protein